MPGTSCAETHRASTVSAFSPQPQPLCFGGPLFCTFISCLVSFFFLSPVTYLISAFWTYFLSLFSTFSLQGCLQRHSATDVAPLIFLPPLRYLPTFQKHSRSSLGINHFSTLHIFLLDFFFCCLDRNTRQHSETRLQTGLNKCLSSRRVPSSDDSVPATPLRSHCWPVRSSPSPTIQNGSAIRFSTHLGPPRPRRLQQPPARLQSNRHLTRCCIRRIYRRLLRSEENRSSQSKRQIQ